MALVQVDPDVLLPLIRDFASATATASYLESLRVGIKREVPPTPRETAAKTSAAEYLQAIETALGANN